MQTDLVQGLMVLLIGMTSVFVILSLIVIAGNLLINVVNKFALKEGDTAVETSNPEDLVVIASIVHKLTKGKGQVLSITHKDEGKKR